jgi:long-chain acyl-CoA synthetase
MNENTAIRIEALIDRVARRYPERRALIFGTRRWSYAQLCVEMGRRAALLVAAGLQPNDVVVTTDPITDDVGLSFLGCCRADCTFLYLTAKLAPAELAEIIGLAGAKLILTADGRAHPAAPMIPALPLHLPGTPDPAAAAEAARRSAAGTPASVAILQPTSGTTGRLPKLARQPHRMLTWQQIAPEMRRSWWDQSSVYYRPPAQYFAVRDFCESLTSGGTHVLAAARRPEAMEHEMATYGATILGAVPAMLRLLVDRAEPPPPNLALRYVRTGAAALPESVAAMAAERYGATILQEYGSTEGGSMIGTPRVGSPRGSIGKPYPGVETRIVDKQGDDLSPDGIGELLVRTPGVMRGYLGDDAATARTIRDGWLWTGDLAHRDAGGFYFLAGRRMLRINVGGFKVAPEEVEAVLKEHPAVHEAVVLGVTDATRGEIVRAVIEPHGMPPSVAELRRFCRARLAEYMVPRQWEFRDALPRSPLGKVLRQNV